MRKYRVYVEVEVDHLETEVEQSAGPSYVTVIFTFLENSTCQFPPSPGSLHYSGVSGEHRKRKWLGSGKEGQVKTKWGDCPVKRKNCSTEAWLSEVELWDSAKNIGDLTKLNTKKYLVVMESIRKAEDRDLERTAEVEFVENR